MSVFEYEEGDNHETFDEASGQEIQVVFRSYW